MIKILIVVLLMDPIVLPQSIDVKSGNVVTISDEKKEIGKGTFIPDPSDKILAKKIIEKNATIESLNVRIKTLEDQAVLFDNHVNEKEKELQDYWNNRYRAVVIENEALKSFWNRYGKTILWCAVSAGGAAVITWGVTRIMK